jgi:hypothetical protein
MVGVMVGSSLVVTFRARPPNSISITVVIKPNIKVNELTGITGVGGGIGAANFSPCASKRAKLASGGGKGKSTAKSVSSIAISNKGRNSAAS